MLGSRTTSSFYFQFLSLRSYAFQDFYIFFPFVLLFGAGDWTQGLKHALPLTELHTSPRTCVLLVIPQEDSGSQVKGSLGAAGCVWLKSGRLGGFGVPHGLWHVLPLPCLRTSLFLGLWRLTFPLGLSVSSRRRQAVCPAGFTQPEATFFCFR
jgi:hypothetical protein